MKKLPVVGQMFWPAVGNPFKLAKVKIMDVLVLDVRQTVDNWEHDVDVLYISQKWSTGFGPAKIRELFGRSTFLLAIQDAKVVGFIRGFTDEMVVTHLSEIVVHKDYQKRGIGRKLVNKFAERYSHTAIYTESLRESAQFFSKGPLQLKYTLLPFSRRAITAQKS